MRVATVAARDGFELETNQVCLWTGTQSFEAMWAQSVTIPELLVAFLGRFKILQAVCDGSEVERLPAFQA